MRKLSLLSLGIALALGGASATAAPLTSATLTLAIWTLPPATLVASGATGAATSNLSATLDAGTAFAGSFTTTLPMTAAPPITQIQVTLASNDALAWSGGPTNAALNGFADIKAFGGLTLLGIPLKLGVPSTVGVSSLGVNITVISGSWTSGATTITLGPTSPTVTAMATGSNGLTAGGQGTLILIAPVKLITHIAGTLPAFGVLTLTYVPEPGTLGLLGGGVLALGALGRRRL